MLEPMIDNFILTEVDALNYVVLSKAENICFMENSLARKDVQ